MTLESEIKLCHPCLFLLIRNPAVDFKYNLHCPVYLGRQLCNYCWKYFALYEKLIVQKKTMFQNSSINNITPTELIYYYCP